MQASARVLLITIIVLASACLPAGIALLPSEATGALSVTFLSVGQGDAVFIETPSGVQMLIDGGKNRAVLRELPRVMALFDRSIDVVVGTHPDADHIGGLPDILKRYRVSLIVRSSVRDPEGADEIAFERAAEREKQEGAVRLVATRGDSIDLGDGVHFDILFPDRDVSNIETNAGSIAGRLVYGETAFIFTGDAPKEIEEYLVQLDGNLLRSDVLKVGHHGSRTSSALRFVGFVSPEYAVYSRGCGNEYGHPHEEVVATMARLSIATLDTCSDGRVTFVSDGRTVQRK